MNRIFTIMLAVLFSSNLFAETKLIDSYEMEHTKESDMYNVVCIDGYQYLMSQNDTATQMKENVGNKYRLVECPIRKSSEDPYGDITE